MDVYTLGDLADPFTCRIFDAATGQEFMKVVKMDLQLNAGARTRTQVRMEQADGTVLVATLVKAPPREDAGKEVYSFDLSMKPWHNLNMTRFVFTTTRYRLNKIGEDRQEDQRRLVAGVTDQDVANFSGDLLTHTARALVLDGFHKIRNELMTRMGLPEESERPLQSLCDECGGSGFWTNPAGGRDSKSPCSKGCKP